MPNGLLFLVINVPALGLGLHLTCRKTMMPKLYHFRLFLSILFNINSMFTLVFKVLSVKILLKFAQLTL